MSPEHKRWVDANKRAQKELDELLDAQATAENELEEADEAEMRMEKERSDMLALKLKVDRCKVSYEETKLEFDIQDDEDEEWLGIYYPIALRERKHYHSILSRYAKEKVKYEHAKFVLEKERAKSQDALARSQKERHEWEESREQAVREQAEVDAIAMTRKFTDPRVSVKERMRSFGGGEVPHFLAHACIGKAVVETTLGEIAATADVCYAGDLRIVEQISTEEMTAAFEKHSLDNGESMDLGGVIRAMHEVGRQINDEEGSRFVRYFDVNGNGRIQYAEFEFGLNNMVGTAMPHGLGQEIFADGSQYGGEFYMDKRSGIGMYITATHHFYMGHWSVGVRNGKGIEGRFSSSKRDAMLPAAIVTYQRGIRGKIVRFTTGNPAHVLVYRDYLLQCATARKRASRARRLVVYDVHRHFLRHVHKNQSEATLMDVAGAGLPSIALDDPSLFLNRPIAES